MVRSAILAYYKPECPSPCFKKSRPIRLATHAMERVCLCSEPGLSSCGYSPVTKTMTWTAAHCHVVLFPCTTADLHASRHSPIMLRALAGTCMEETPVIHCLILYARPISLPYTIAQVLVLRLYSTPATERIHGHTTVSDSTMRRLHPKRCDDRSAHLMNEYGVRRICLHHRRDGGRCRQH